MSVEEFNIQFDVLYNNITSNSAPGLNAYEKSVFLTKAQLEILKNYLQPTNNQKQLGIDDSSKRLIDFKNLIVEEAFDATRYTGLGGIVKPTWWQVTIPTNTNNQVLSILNEEVWLLGPLDELLGTRQVIPLSSEEYALRMSRPFKEPLKNQAWRLLSKTNSDGNAILVLTTKDCNTISSMSGGILYRCRYVKVPTPIILENLTQYGVTISGKSAASAGELDERLHQEILQRAVELAKASWQGDLNASITMGARSE